METDRRTPTTTRPKALTLSFRNDGECIIIEDSMIEEPVLPQVNLNGTIIDLTDDSPQTPAPARKVIVFDMMMSRNLTNTNTASASPALNTSQPSPIIFDVNNNLSRPSTSKQQQPAVAGPAALPQPTTSRRTLEFSLAAPTLLAKNATPRTVQRVSLSGYQELLNAARNRLLENREDFVCSLCNIFYEIGAGVMLKSCLHTFCRLCLVETIKTNSNFGAVKCPLQVESCESYVRDDEIEELLGQEGYAMFLQEMQAKLEEIADQTQKARDDEESQQSLIPLLLNMDDLEVIPNLRQFECPVCFTDIAIGEGVQLKNCLHHCCRDCLAGCITASEDFEVKCPFIEPDDTVCMEVLQEREIRNLVSPEEFERHLQKSLNVAEHANELTFHCRTPNCPAFFEIDEAEIQSFTCQVCKHVNCVKCKAVHEGKSCLDYQEEVNPALKDQRMQNENTESMKAIETMIAGGTAMFCPRCRIPVMKIAGCDFVTCIACKLGICWCTKKPRHNFTRADGTVVAGCMCREAGNNGQLCDPKCGNCH